MRNYLPPPPATPTCHTHPLHPSVIPLPCLPASPNYYAYCPVSLDLYFCFVSSKVDILVVLLKNGADLTLRNTDGKTPMDYANDATTVKLLEDFQNKGETILSQYSGLPKTTDHLVGFSLGRRGSHTKASIHSPPNIIQQSRTLDHVKVDIEHAKTAASELTAQRELRQQESKKVCLFRSKDEELYKSSQQALYFSSTLHIRECVSQFKCMCVGYVVYAGPRECWDCRQ